MIFGDCPYCGEPSMRPCAERCPAFSRDRCDACGKEYWQRHSRIDPEAYTIEEFAEKYIIDEATKIITEKNPPKPPSPEDHAIAELLADKMVDAILYGEGTEMPTGLLKKKGEA